MQIKLKIKFQMRFVIDTINSGIQKYPTDNLIIHSDRGVHYKNNVYQMLLKNNNIQQSTSAPAAPRDNAPIESFFGHLKDEVNYKKCNNFEELKDKIDKYVYYYNTSRYQWNRNMLAPIEIRDNLISYNYCPF